MRYFVTLPSGREVPVDIALRPTGAVEVSVDGRPISVETLSQTGPITTLIDNKIVELWIEGEPPEVGVVARGHRFYAKVESERMRALSVALGGKHAAGTGVVVSPMPGRVLKILVNEGDVVNDGTPLVVVEAMKMENELFAARDGVVKKIFVKPGQTVDGGAHLIEIV